MTKTLQDFKRLFTKHAMGLPLTALLSVFIGRLLPFFRWMLHSAFLTSQKRGIDDEEHFPVIFLNVIAKHILFYLVMIVLFFLLILALLFLTGVFVVLGNMAGQLYLFLLLLLLLVVLIFFFFHPLSFFVTYSWELEEKGFAGDLKLLLSYVVHYFKRPFAHLFFSVKCYCLYLLGLFCVLVPLVLLLPFIYLINAHAAWYRAGMVAGFSLVFLGMGIVAANVVFLMYICPFISFVTLKLYEPLAPKSARSQEVLPLPGGGETHFWKLTVSYDGTKFCGWQYQIGARTVQGELTDALRKLLRENITLTASSRTDSGVHALGQTVSFGTSRDIPAEKLLKGLNSFVPEDISVTKVETVDASFHPTFNAFGKHYRYCVYTADSDDVMTRKYHYWIRRDFDIEAMRAAAAVMVGEREFKGLQVKSGKPNEATLRLVTAVEINCSGSEIAIDIFGKGFMYKQVRSMVGLLLAVGEGRVKALEVDALCSGEAKCRMTSVAPPQGLTLVKVYYSKEEFEARS